MKVTDLRGPGADPVADPVAVGADSEPAPRLTATGPGARAAPTPAWALAAAGAVLAGAVFLRFVTRSHLWLDEALTVNIARLPLGRIPDALRHDGSPPLYYLLLHGWIRLFGAGDVAVRALSGLFGIVSLPLAWVAGRRIGGRAVAWTSLLLVATSPFAVRYSTEARMYMLIVDLTLAGYLLVDSALRRPTVPRLAGVATVSGLLLLTHYWSLFLIGAVIVMLAWLSRPGRAGAGAARRTLAAVLGGFVLLVPWLPIFAFQLRHTGTPWSEPASFSAMVNAVSDFAGGGTSSGRALGLVFFGLAGLGLFGRALDGRRIELDLRTRPRARGVAFAAGGTLFIAVVGGFALRSAFQARYAAVIFGLFILLVSLGILTFADRRIRLGVLAAAVAFGLAGSATNVTTDRTQAGRIAAAVAAGARPGDVVAYCPDQLGPSVSRVLPSGRYDQLTFPAGTGPERVDWVDYARRNRAGDPAGFARMLVARAGPGHEVWLVWSPDYRTFEGKCGPLESQLAALRPHSQAVLLQQARYFEHANLVRYWPS